MSKRKQKRKRFRDRQREQKRHLAEQRRCEFAALVAKLDPDRILYLPLDIGKNVNWMRADTGAGRVVHPPKALLAYQEGYAYWRDCVRGYLAGGSFDLLVAGNEPTGIYHENWSHHILNDFSSYLSDLSHPRLLYRFINPYQSKLERQKITLRPRNTDPLALVAISSLLRQGLGTPASAPDPQTALLHQYAAFSHQGTRKLRAVNIDVQRQFDRIWPGAVVNVNRFKRGHPDLPIPSPIVQTKPLERASIRLLLHHCPDPYRVRQLGVQGIIDLFHQHDLRCGPVTARRIWDCANNSLLSPPDVVAVYLLGLEQLLADEKHWLQRRQWAENHLETIALATPARHLLSIRGISPLWAAYYLDLVGSPPRFDCASQVWAFVGFDTRLDSSGDDDPNARFRITRRGEPFYRHTLTWMSTLAAGHHPTFGQAFVAAEERGKGVWGAAIHTAHKLNRVCFRLVTEDRPYRDDTHPDDLARWRSYWLAFRRFRSNPKLHPHPGSWRPAQ